MELLGPASRGLCDGLTDSSPHSAVFEVALVCFDNVLPEPSGWAGFDAVRCCHFLIKQARAITGGRTELESRDSPLASGLLVLAGPAIFDVSAVRWDQEPPPPRGGCCQAASKQKDELNEGGNIKRGNKGAERKATMEGNHRAWR